jgi:hypothetical protein
MKLQASPAQLPGNDWMDGIDGERCEIERLHREQPSPRREVAGLIEGETPCARGAVLRTLVRYGEQPASDLGGLSYAEEQILGDWFAPRA